MPVHSHQHPDADAGELSVRPQFGLGLEDVVPRHEMPAAGMAPRTAYQIIHDELMLDGNARLNLATFVTTWMEPEAELLMNECSPKNMIDKDEYPQTAEIESRCVNMLSRLWHASAGEAVGGSTTGSSEACMLGGLALKWRWRQRRQAAGLPGDKPNLVMGTNVQVCWEKFCRYFDVEPRFVNVGPKVAHLTAKAAVAACDENTIGVVAILGSTFDGAYEPVAGIAKELDRLAAKRGGADIPIHVDGASGAMIAPFLDAELAWDFRIPRVQSINTSGHKYGLVYPGVGWIIWRDSAALPDDLVFKVDYLGGEMPTFALNFSRPGAQVVAQYFNFLRLGMQGYADVQDACRRTAMWLSSEIAKIGPYRLMSKGDELPVFAFKMSDGAPFTVYEVSDALRGHGWLVPAYPMPEGMEDVSVLRVVVRNGFSRDLARMLLADLKRVTGELSQRASHSDAAAAASHEVAQRPARTGFHH
ncbi:MAG: glutamate decarboxylase [Acidimicrobiales bacterium]